MLATPAKSTEECVARYKSSEESNNNFQIHFSAEFKYDGERAQIHIKMANGDSIQVELFSRRCENMTVRYPDIVSLF